MMNSNGGCARARRPLALDEIANFLGNAAAHAALLPDSLSAQKEVMLYSSEAEETFLSKNWNKEEIEYLRNKALLRTRNEIKNRIKRYGFDEKDYEKFANIAEQYINQFIENGVKQTP